MTVCFVVAVALTRSLVEMALTVWRVRTGFLLSKLNEKHLAGHPVRFFLASTSEVYGKNPKETWHEEDDLVFGSTTRARWSYGCSKAIDEFLALGYWRQTKLPVVIGRFFNVVGPRQTGAYGMVFCCIDNKILTPSLTENILPGVTRKVILELTIEFNFVTFSLCR